MARYVSNRDGGKTNEEGHYRFHVNGWSGNVLDDGLKVKQNSPLGMSVLIEPGDLKIGYQNYGYTAWNDADEAVTISTADGSNPRIDRIVAYIDRVMSPSPSNSNNPGMLKFMTVAGTPAGSPVAANDATVNSAVSNNPWCELAQVRVNAGVTTIDNSKITDKRTIATPKLASGSVTADKRSGGYYIGTINISSGTGNQSFTGVGFKPKLVKFTWSNQSTGTIAKAYGHMTDNGQYTTAESYDASNRAYTVSTTRCFITANTVGAVNREYSYVSMDNDGFTINRNVNTGTPVLIIECYA